MTPSITLFRINSQRQSTILLNVILLKNAVLLSVILLDVIALNVVAPSNSNQVKLTEVSLKKRGWVGWGWGGNKKNITSVK
jgi:hypothetical protein